MNSFGSSQTLGPTTRSEDFLFFYFIIIMETLFSPPEFFCFNFLLGGWGGGERSQFLPFLTPTETMLSR